MPIFTQPFQQPGDNRRLSAPNVSGLETPLGRAAGQRFEEGVEGSYQAARTLIGAGFDRAGLLGDERMSVSEANRLGADYGLTFDREVTPAYLGILIDQKQTAQERSDLVNRAPTGLAASTALTAASFGGMAVDPVNAASAFVPVVGQARYLQLLGRYGKVGGRFATGVIEGVAGAAMLEPLTAGAAAVREDEYGLTDTMVNLTFGGILGGGLHMVGGEVGDAYRGGGLDARSRMMGYRENLADTRRDVVAKEFQKAADGFSADVGAGARAGGDALPPESARAAGPTTVFSAADKDLAVRIMLGEAGGEGDEGLAAVANVIANRLERPKNYGAGLRGVLTKKYAFEAYGNPDARDAIMALPQDAKYRRAAALFDEVMGGRRGDNTGGSTHYLNRQLQGDLGREQPAWSKGKVLAQIGRHTFLSPDGEPVRLRNGKYENVPAADSPEVDLAALREPWDAPPRMAQEIDELPYDTRAELIQRAVQQVSEGKAVNIGRDLQDAFEGLTRATDDAAAAGRLDAPQPDQVGEIRTPDLPDDEARWAEMAAADDGRVELPPSEDLPAFNPNDLRQVRRETGTRVSSLLQFVRSEGGIDFEGGYRGELKTLADGRKGSRLQLHRRGGAGLDEMARRAEAAGYISRGTGDTMATPDDLLRALERELGGERVYPREVADQVAAKAADQRMYDYMNERYQATPDSWQGDLTLRQSDVDAYAKLLESGNRELDDLLDGEGEMLKGLELTADEKAYLAEADDLVKQVAGFENVVRASTACILKG